MPKNLRPRKDGGLSVCASPDDKVGKGRCNHVLDNAETVQIVYKEDEKCYYIDASTYSEKKTYKAQEKIVRDFFRKLEEELTVIEKEEAIKAISGH